MISKIQVILLVAIVVFETNLCASETYLASDKGYIKMDVSYDIPRVITNIPANEYDGSVEEIASQYLSDNSVFLFNDSQPDIEILKTVNNPSGTHVAFHQVINNIPVIGSEIVVSLNQNDEITMVTNSYHPNISPGTDPLLSSEDAIDKAESICDNPIVDIISPIKNKLKIFVDSNRLSFLVYELSFGTQYGEDWYILVNAIDGEILLKEDISLEYGSVRVFDPDPGTFYEDINLPDNEDQDYPELYNAYKIKDIQGLNPPVDGYYSLKGEYAYSKNYNTPDPPLAIEITPDFIYDRSQTEFEEANCYYHLDKMIRYVRSLGLDPRWEDNLTIENDKDILYDAVGSLVSSQFFPTMDCIIYKSPTYGKDSGEDQSVIIHELGHAFHDALLLGGLTIRPSVTLRSISEGISDYLAIDYRRQQSYYRQNERSNWFSISSLIPPTISNDDSVNFTNWEEYNTDLIYSVNMRIWASSLMDLEYNISTDASQGERLGRDIVTTLQLTSLSYLTKDNDQYDNVLAMYQADIDIYNGEHLRDLIQVYHDRKLFIDENNQIINSDITEDTTWSGYKYITSDITISNGSTLTIDPNTYVILDGNIIIQDGGSLSAYKTTFTGTNGWNGIVAEVGSNVIMNGATITNAQTGVSATGAANVDIQNCSFTDCYNGVSLTNCLNFIIEDNDFSGMNSGYDAGISLIECGGEVKGNEISNFVRGMYLTLSSTNLIENYIHDNLYQGVYITGYNIPQMINTTTTRVVQNNKITDNGSSQIALVYNANVYMNNGYNNIYAENTDEIPTVPCIKTLGWQITPSKSTLPSIVRINAERNYWGYSDINLRNRDYFFEVGVNSLRKGYSIDYDPYAENPFISEYGDIPTFSLNEPPSPESNQLSTAIKLEDMGNYTASINLYETIIDKFSDTPESYVASARLPYVYLKAGTDPNLLIKTYDTELESDDISLKKFYKQMKITAHTKGKKYDEAIALAEEMKLEAQSEEEIILADISIAIANIMKDAEGKGKSDVDYSQKLNDLLTQLNGKGEDKPITNPSDIAEIVLPERTELYQNYPNPFNPVTQIKFALAKDSDVKLSVYNGNGQKVKELVNETKSAGYHTVNFDGSKLNSGVYYYQLDVEGQSISKRMVLMK